MESTLKKYFGYSEFRPYQKEIIHQIINKRDCLIVMATGSGKSLCYQLPPLLTGKTAVVVSPLISLMQDQVMSLKQRGIKAEYLGSAQTDPTVQTKAETGHFHLLFMTPEKACLIPTSFWSNLLQVGISLFAVDEAHCISEWGHDFRVEYKQLDKLHDTLMDVPFVGLTATATEKVRIDIMNSLKMKDPYVAIGSFDRKNLFYGVKVINRGQSFVDELVKEISVFEANAGSTIIYCLAIKDVEQIFKAFSEVGIKAGMYHGQMGSKAREETHRLFITDEVRVMVATIAFGMGIDKPDIRRVIHYGCPKSLECYYQESGRCGRDGIASTCWLYFARSDFAKAEFYSRETKTENQRKAVMESLSAAQHYCLSTTCRRKLLLNHFGEIYSAEKCGNCDNCTILKRERNMSKESYALMACIRACQGNWGLNMPIDVLRGSRSKKVLDAHFDKLQLHGLGRDHSSNWWKMLAYQLIFSGYLMETFKDVYRTVSVSQQGKQYLSLARPDYQPPLVLPLTDEMIAEEEHESTLSKIGELKSSVTLEHEGFSEAEAQLYRMLLEERMKLARVSGTAPYAVCGDQTIKKIALTRPSTKARLANIDGVNQQFMLGIILVLFGKSKFISLMLQNRWLHLVMTHGDHLLQIVRHLSQKLNLSLDGEVVVRTISARKLYPVANNQRKLTPAKFEAWKLWHEEGLSIQKVSNHPGRSAPIKEQTVVEYLLEAAQEGFEIDWTRLCVEVGLKNEILSAIQVAISKVGSTDKLKPIKNELPEEISYAHIKLFLAMENCGKLQEVMATSHNKADEFLSKALQQHSTDACHIEEPHEEESPKHMVANCSSHNNEESASLTSTGAERPELAHHDDDDNDNERGSVKRQRVENEAGSSSAFQATESSIINFIQEYDEGVSLSDILEYFVGSEVGAVIDLLSCLEGEFVIFKKNNLYRLL